MKRVLAGLIAGIVLTGGTAFGASQWSHKSNGVWCKTSVSSGSTMILCVPLTGKGYGVGISRDLIMVVDLRRRKAILTRLHSEG